MDEETARFVEEARQEIRKAVGELKEIHGRLARIRAGLLGNALEASQEDLPAATDGLTGIRTAVECVNHDFLGPAIRNLLAAADDPAGD